MRFYPAQRNTFTAAAQGSGWFSAAMTCVLLIFADIVLAMSVVFFVSSGFDVRLRLILAVSVLLVGNLLIARTLTSTRKR